MAKILYVEDNEDNVYMLQRRLTRKGFDVVIAENGQVGVDKSKSENPDLILMDLSMPVMDGWDAIKIIKGDEAQPVRRRMPSIARCVAPYFLPLLPHHRPVPPHRPVGLAAAPLT